MHVDLHMLIEAQSLNGQWHPACDPGSLYPGQPFDRVDFVPLWRGYDPAVIALMTGIQLPDLTATGITPISPIRGLPDDLSDDHRAAQTARSVLGHHHHSWLTLAEWQTYSWLTLATVSRRITAAEWMRTSPTRQREITESALRLASGSIEWEYNGLAITAIRTSFRCPIQTLVEDLLRAVAMPLAATLVTQAGNDPARVRMVFGLSS